MTRPKASIILIKMISSHQPENGKILKSTALTTNKIMIHSALSQNILSFLCSKKSANFYGMLLQCYQDGKDLFSVGSVANSGHQHM